jgi:hypothetical protein
MFTVLWAPEASDGMMCFASVESGKTLRSG